MIGKIREMVKSILEEEKKGTLDKIVLLDPSEIPGAEPEMRLIGLFCEVIDEKVAELAQALLYLN